MGIQLKMPVPSNRVVRIAWTIAGLIALLVFAGTVTAVVQLSTGYEALDRQAGNQSEALDTVIDTTEDLDAALKKANRRLRENDLPTVTEPEPVDPEIIAGAVGPTGATGATGRTGATGAAGATGRPGADGADGETIIGPVGPEGPAGATGDAGPKGDKGDTGPKGDKGDPGPKGDKGDKGDTGVAGTNGANGTNGVDGANGTNGVDGTDAVPFTFLFTIPADETLPDLSPAQTYSCIIPEPGGPFTCELVAA